MVKTVLKENYIHVCTHTQMMEIKSLGKLHLSNQVTESLILVKRLKSY